MVGRAPAQPPSHFKIRPAQGYISKPRMKSRAKVNETILGMVRGAAFGRPHQYPYDLFIGFGPGFHFGL